MKRLHEPLTYLSGGITSSLAAYSHQYTGVVLDYQKPDPVGMHKHQPATPLVSPRLHTLFIVNSKTASTQRPGPSEFLLPFSCSKPVFL